jgi:hypothetical protein
MFAWLDCRNLHLFPEDRSLDNLNSLNSLTRSPYRSLFRTAPELLPGLEVGGRGRGGRARALWRRCKSFPPLPKELDPLRETSDMAEILTGRGAGKILGPSGHP